MQFEFDIRLVFKDELTCLHPGMSVFKSGNSSNGHKEIAQIIDKMGESSAMAQCLPQIITSFRKFRNSNHKLYVLSDLSKNRVLGILKSGRKHLFIHDKDGVCVETEPICVLDFFVHESKQRQGCGKRLFDRMLKDEHVIPCAVAVDSPSSKMLQFLLKHYGLKNPIFASNNYVIFPGFFQEQKNKQNLDDESTKFDGGRTQEDKRRLSSSLSREYSVVKKQSHHLTQRSAYFAPHTRVQPMPTSMTVIRPKVYEECNFDSIINKADQVQTSEQARLRPIHSVSPRNSTGTGVRTRKENLSPKCIHPPAGDGSRNHYPVLTTTQLNVIQSLPLCSRKRGTYTYLNAVRHHNGHTRLW